MADPKQQSEEKQAAEPMPVVVEEKPATVDTVAVYSATNAQLRCGVKGPRTGYKYRYEPGQPMLVLPEDAPVLVGQGAWMFEKPVAVFNPSETRVLTVNCSSQRAYRFVPGQPMMVHPEDAKELLKGNWKNKA